MRATQTLLAALIAALALSQPSSAQQLLLLNARIVDPAEETVTFGSMRIRNGLIVAVGELEGFVVDRIREIGRDPRLVRETISAARKELLERRPKLDRNLKDLGKTEKKLATERRNLLDAVAGNGSRSPGVFEKLGEVEAEYDQVTRQSDQARAELAALDHQAIDEKDLRAALASFEPVWTELFPAERARILHLLIEEVRTTPRQARWRSRSGTVAFGRWPERTGGRRREQADRHVQDQGEEAEAGDLPPPSRHPQGG